MFHPTRGGTRGGAAEFKWSAVQSDKDRENYLGHSINAPAGRWQKNKDIHWYSRENDVGVDALTRAAEQKAEEIKRIKEMEEDALAVALGFAPKERGDGEGTGANGIEVKKSEKELELERAEKDERAARKAAKREKKEIKEMERSVRKDIKRAEKEKLRANRSGRGEREGPRYRSRSPDSRERKRERYRESSPSRSQERREDGYRNRDRDHERRREDDRYSTDRRHRDARENQRDNSATPTRAERYRSNTASHPNNEPYDPEAERAKDRARWEKNHDREVGKGSGWGERSGFARDRRVDGL